MKDSELLRLILEELNEQLASNLIPHIKKGQADKWVQFIRKYESTQESLRSAKSMKERESKNTG